MIIPLVGLVGNNIRLSETILLEAEQEVWLNAGGVLSIGGGRNVDYYGLRPPNNKRESRKFFEERMGIPSGLGGFYTIEPRGFKSTYRVFTGDGRKVWTDEMY